MPMCEDGVFDDAVSVAEECSSVYATVDDTNVCFACLSNYFSICNRIRILISPSFALLILRRSTFRMFNL